MIGDLLQQLRDEVGRATGLTEDAKSKLLAHLEAMEECTGTEGAEDADKAKAQSTLERLSSSLERLEGAHPEITSIIGRLAVALANVGI